MASVTTSVDIFRRVIDPDQGSLSPDFARYIETWHFPDDDHTRYEELSLKAQDGTLSSEERDLLEAYLQADGLISLLKMKARRSLQEQA
jgi:hypothetical protein